MIFYFSGTGNSFYVAKTVGDPFKDKLVSIPKAMKSQEDLEYTLATNENIGFVFPIHAWGPPKMVIDFINSMTLLNYNENYVYAIATCGENVGNSFALLKKTLKKKGVLLNSSFSLVMPNNYTIFGDVYPKEKEKSILEAAEIRINKIKEYILKETKDIELIDKGPFPSLLTSLVNPMFTKNAMNPSKFYATEACTACGLCEDVCITGNIKITDLPHWGNNCTQCLACLNYCPVQAIQYGKSTIKKGRYTNPNVRNFH